MTREFDIRNTIPRTTCESEHSLVSFLCPARDVYTEPAIDGVLPLMENLTPTFPDLKCLSNNNMARHLVGWT